MATEYHPITEALRNVDKLLRETTTEPVSLLRGERFHLVDERHLLAALAATVTSLQELTKSLATQLPSANSRGVVESAADPLATASSILRDGEGKASEWG